MKWINYIFSYILQEILILIFNSLIITKLLSDEDVENVVKETAERSFFKPAMILVDLMEKASKKDDFDQSDKVEKNELLKTYQNYITLLLHHQLQENLWMYLRICRRNY